MDKPSILLIHFAEYLNVYYLKPFWKSIILYEFSWILGIWKNMFVLKFWECVHCFDFLNVKFIFNANRRSKLNYLKNLTLHLIRDVIVNEKTILESYLMFRKICLALFNNFPFPLFLCMCINFTYFCYYLFISFLIFIFTLLSLMANHHVLHYVKFSDQENKAIRVSFLNSWKTMQKNSQVSDSLFTDEKIFTTYLTCWTGKITPNQLILHSI